MFKHTDKDLKIHLPFKPITPILRQSPQELKSGLLDEKNMQTVGKGL